MTEETQVELLDLLQLADKKIAKANDKLALISRHAEFTEDDAYFREHLRAIRENLLLSRAAILTAASEIEETS